MSVLSGEPSVVARSAAANSPRPSAACACGAKRIQHGVGPEVGRPEILLKPVDGRAVRPAGSV